MARRSDHTREQLESIILNTTFDLVKKQGYQQVSTRKIAAEIGYTVGTLYNVFNNLDEIFIHVNSKIIDILVFKLNEIIRCQMSIETQLHNIAEEYLKFSQEDYHLWCLLFEYRFPDEQVIPQWYIDKIHKLYEIVELMISKISFCQSEKSAYNITAIFWSGIHGVCVLASKGKFARINLGDTKNLIRQLIDSILFYAKSQN